MLRTVFNAMSGVVLIVLSALPPQLLAASENEILKLEPDALVANDWFGASVSIYDDTAAIGAKFDNEKGVDSGAVYVYTRSNGLWNKPQKLTAGDGFEGNFFGQAVSVDANRLAVGALNDHGMAGSSGAVYIFEKNGTGWVQTSKLKPNDSSDLDYFGFSLDLERENLVVGAAGHSKAGFQSGSAYVFNNAMGSWREVSQIHPASGAEKDYFGVSVAISGDSVIVGALGEGISGAAYIYRHLGSSWAFHQRLVNTDAGQHDAFGNSVSIDGDTALIGAFGKKKGNGAYGAAYIFEQMASTWTQTAKLESSDIRVLDGFGISTSIEAGRAIIGAHGANFNPPIRDAGSAYFFALTGSGWAEVKKFGASDGKKNDRLGYSVSLSGNTAIAGTRFHDGKGNNAGAAYLFDLQN